MQFRHDDGHDLSRQESGLAGDDARNRYALDPLVQLLTQEPPQFLVGVGGERSLRPDRVNRRAVEGEGPFDGGGVPGVLVEMGQHPPGVERQAALRTACTSDAGYRLGEAVEAGFADQVVSELAESVDQLRRPGLTTASGRLDCRGANRVFGRDECDRRGRVQVVLAGRHFAR